jgi:5-methylcytosine-specific restriction enzyme subunit McrC
MKIIQVREQQLNAPIVQCDSDAAIPFIEDGKELVFCVKRGRELNYPCLSLIRKGMTIYANGSYYVGIDWINDGNLAIQVNPKMNDVDEIDFVRMLNDSLADADNFEHLKDLLTIHFDKPSIRINQKDDHLSVFLIVEFLNLLHKITQKGLKKSFHIIENNLASKVKGKILVGRNIRENIIKGRMTDNVCQYQVYDIDTPENRILKRALCFCVRQLSIYKNAIDTSRLEYIARQVRPYFENVGNDVSVKTIKAHKGNPVYKEYNLAVEFAQLLLKRYSYNITIVGNKEITTPPYWIDMSKLFELYVYHHLRRVFTAKGEIHYHVHANYQELDYLLKPKLWNEPYVIDAKYKPQYKENNQITKDDAREVSGYARLSAIYNKLGLQENSAPIKCLIIYPDQEQNEYFEFSRENEPTFTSISDYVRMYKLGIRLPIIKST